MLGFNQLQSKLFKVNKMFTFNAITEKGSVVTYERDTYEKVAKLYFAWIATRNTPAWIAENDMLLVAK